MKRTLLLMFLFGATVVAGCGPNKSAARLAITAAQTSLDAAKDQAMMIVPDQVLGIQAAIDGATMSMDRGEFKTAIDSANVIPARVKAMADGLAARTAEMQAAWEKMKEFPQALIELNERVVKLARAKPLPQGIDREQVAAARAALGTITQNWTAAQAAYQAGNLAEAMARAHVAMHDAADAMNSLKLALPEMMK